MKNELEALKKALSEKDYLINSLNEDSLALQVQLEISQGKSAQLAVDNAALNVRVNELEEGYQTKILNWQCLVSCSSNLRRTLNGLLHS